MTLKGSVAEDLILHAKQKTCCIYIFMSTLFHKREMIQE